MSLVLMRETMLSKSLILFSVDGWSCVPSLYLPGAKLRWDIQRAMAVAARVQEGLEELSHVEGQEGQR